MSYQGVLLLIGSAFIFALGLFIFLRHTKSSVNRSFGQFSLVTSVWLLAYSLAYFMKTEESALFWFKIGYTAMILMPVSFYQFTYSFLDLKAHKFILIAAYVLSFLFIPVLYLTDMFVSGLYIYSWGYYPIAGFLHPLYMVFLLFTIGGCDILLLRKYWKIRKMASLYKQRVLYICIAFFICTFTLMDFIPNYGTEVYPGGFLFVMLFVGIIAYSIVRHRLMDLRIVLRRSSVYGLSLFTILVMATGIRQLSSLLFADGFKTISNIITLVLALIFFASIRNYFYKMANKYFFTSLYDSRELIMKIGDELRTLLDPGRIYDLLYNNLSKAFHFEIFAIAGFNKKENNFPISYNRGVSLGEMRKISYNDQLDKTYFSLGKPMLIEEAKTLPYKAQTQKIIIDLAERGVEVVVPLNTKTESVGLMLLGKKVSNDMYNEDDLQVLEIISSQVAMAIENSQLFEGTRAFGRRLKREVFKAREELESANLKLKQLDEAKSDFISIASHQLRTPLTIIKGYISMILEGNFGKLNQMETDSLDKAYQSNERLIQLVENLLIISRIESGRIQYSYELMKFEDLVDGVVEDVRGIAYKKGLKFEYKKPKKKLPKVMIDEEKIRHTVTNLIDNAIKFTKQGTVTVTLEVVENELRFCVKDTGPGITPEIKGNLFKKFARDIKDSLSHAEGTGLGLYVSKEMIDAHKGKIWVESKGVLQGSTFCFSLPLGKNVNL